MSKVNKWIFKMGPIIFAGLLSFIGCGTPGKNMPVTMGTAIVGADQVQELKVEVHDYYFKPSQINVLVNVPVRLIFKNGTLIVPHNFSIHAPEAGIDIDKDVGAGRTVAVEFTPTKVGEYTFFCDKDHHKNKGMTGTLVVKSSM
jgi:plastocyanin domain-containing protein